MSSVPSTTPKTGVLGAVTVSDIIPVLKRECLYYTAVEMYYELQSMGRDDEDLRKFVDGITACVRESAPDPNRAATPMGVSSNTLESASDGPPTPYCHRDEAHGEVRALVTRHLLATGHADAAALYTSAPSTASALGGRRRSTASAFEHSSHHSSASRRRSITLEEVIERHLGATPTDGASTAPHPRATSTVADTEHGGKHRMDDVEEFSVSESASEVNFGVRLNSLAEENERLKKQATRLQESLDAARREVELLTKKQNAIAPHGMTGDKKRAMLEKEIHSLMDKVVRLEGREESVLGVIGDRLPTIIAALSPSKKESVIPVILSVLECHPTNSVRCSLSYYLLNLFKRPDAEQRAGVLDALKALCLKLEKDPHRIENELSAELWPMARHKYPERRCLAVCAAGILTPFVRMETRVAFLRGILEPLSSDASTVVRESICAAFSSVCNGVASESEDIAGASELLLRLALDRKDTVSHAALEKLLPEFSSLCVNLGCIVTVLVRFTLDALSAIVRQPPMETSERNGEILTRVLRMVFVNIAEHVHTPLADALEEVSSDVSLCLSMVFPFCIGLLSDGCTRQHANILAQLFGALSLLTSALGTPFRTRVEPLFHEAMASSDPEVQSAALSAYLLHHSALQESDAITKCIADCIRGVLERRAPWSPQSLDHLLAALGRAGRHGSDPAVILIKAVWESVDSPHAHVRTGCIACFLQLLHCVPKDTVVKSLWPALIVLASDKSDEVRRAAVWGIGRLAMTAASPAVLDNIFQTLFATMNADGILSEITREVLVMWKDTMRETGPDIRETYILPSLTSLVLSWSRVDDDATKQQLAGPLLGVYTSAFACSTVSPALVEAHVLPSLRVLQQHHDREPKLFDAAHRQELNAIAKDAQMLLASRQEPKSFFDKVKMELNSIVNTKLPGM